MNLLRDFGKITGTLTFLAALIVGFTKVVDGHLPPWLSVASASEMQKQMDRTESLAISTATNLLYRQLDDAWEQHRKDPQNERTKDEIRRVTRQIKDLDSRAQLNTPPS